MSDYLIIVRHDEELNLWVVDEDSCHILEDDGGNYPVQELQVHTIRGIGHQTDTTTLSSS